MNHSFLHGSNWTVIFEINPSFHFEWFVEEVVCRGGGRTPDSSRKKPLIAPMFGPNHRNHQRPTCQNPSPSETRWAALKASRGASRWIPRCRSIACTAQPAAVPSFGLAEQSGAVFLDRAAWLQVVRSQNRALHSYRILGPWSPARRAQNTKTTCSWPKEGNLPAAGFLSGTASEGEKSNFNSRTGTFSLWSSTENFSETFGRTGSELWWFCPLAVWMRCSADLWGNDKKLKDSEVQQEPRTSSESSDRTRLLFCRVYELYFETLVKPLPVFFWPSDWILYRSDERRHLPQVSSALNRGGLVTFTWTGFLSELQGQSVL